MSIAARASLLRTAFLAAGLACCAACGNFDPVDLATYGATELKVGYAWASDTTDPEGPEGIGIALARPSSPVTRGEDDACLHPLDAKVVARLNGKELKRLTSGEPEYDLMYDHYDCGWATFLIPFESFADGEERVDELVVEDGSATIRLLAPNLAVQRRLARFPPTTLRRGSSFTVSMSPVSEVGTMKALLKPVETSWYEDELRCSLAGADALSCQVDSDLAPGQYDLAVMSDAPREVRQCEGVAACSFASAVGHHQQVTVE